MTNMIMPDMYFKSVYDIDYEKLKNNDIKCLIFSLNNTLVPVNLKSPNKNIKDFIEDLTKMGFKIIIVSNDSKDRVEPFKEILSIDSAYNAKKPFKGKFKKIKKIYKYSNGEIAMIGNEIFTDIFSANRMDFTSILVNSIGISEFSKLRFTKVVNNLLYNYLTKKELIIKGRYYD